MSKNNNNSITNILEKINHKCPKHKSDIGGMCVDISCHSLSQMKCVKCLAEPSCCTRTKKHQFLTVSEFVELFFNTYYHNLINDFTTTKQVKISENYCRNSELILQTFSSKRNKLLQEFSQLYSNFLNQLNQIKEDFELYLENILNTKEQELKEALTNLNLTTHYETLEGFNKEKLLLKMSLMPFDCLNSTLNQLKQGVFNLISKKHIYYNKQITAITSIQDDAIYNYFKNDFLKLQSDLTTTFNTYKEEINLNLFKINCNINLENSCVETLEMQKPLTNGIKIYDKPIDYSPNSNFIEDKKFVIYQLNKDKQFYLAYPTLLNHIKIEQFSNKFINKIEFSEITSQENIYVDLNSNNKDSTIYFKLIGHKSRISELKYYFDKHKQIDYLISSSEDHSIIIWNLTNIDKYQTNPKLYTNISEDNVKSLIGHKDRITSFDLLYDQESKLHFVISCAVADKIKIWDLNSGEHMKDLYDRTSQYKGMYEYLLTCANINKKNYLFTTSQENIIKIWDFDTGKVINAVKYINGATIIQIKYYASYNALMIIDVKSTCGICYIEHEKEINLINMKMLREGGMMRNGIEFLNDNQIIVFGNTGNLTLYDIEETKFIDKKRIADKGITWIQVVDRGNKKLLACHCCDQRLKIFCV